MFCFGETAIHSVNLKNNYIKCKREPIEEPHIFIYIFFMITCKPPSKTLKVCYMCTLTKVTIWKKQNNFIQFAIISLNNWLIQSVMM